MSPTQEIDRYLKEMWRLLIFLICVLPFSVQAQIKLSSNFESGTPLRVIKKQNKVGYTSLKVQTRLDPENKKYPKDHRSSRWFYFLMSGVKGDSVVMTLNGTDPLRAMYSYDNVNFKRFSESDFDKSVLHKRFDRDSVYVAYFTPYTYSKLQRNIEAWRKSRFVKVDTIGYSSKGLPLQLLTITDHSVDNRDKKGVWVQARVHPSESPSSFMVEGVIERLSEMEPDLLKKTIFYVLPMSNPGGVFSGFSRSDVNGVDHEGNYNSEEEETTTEVTAIKGYITSLFENSNGIELFLNLHAQIANKSSFWIHTANSSSTLLYNKKRLISAHTEMFPQKERGNDGVIERRDRVPEGWVFNNWGDRCVAMTLEVPYTYYSTKDMWVDESNLYLYGSDIVDVAANSIGEATSKSVIIDDTIRRRGWERVSGVLCYGDDALQAKKKSAKAVFETPNLSVGMWDIYRWNVVTEAWERFDEIIIKNSKKNIPIGIKAKYKGEFLDAIMFIKRENV